MDSQVRKRVKDFVSDRQSGSMELASEAVEIFKDFISIISTITIPDAITGLGMELIRGQPSMAPIINIVNRICVEAETASPPEKLELLSALLEHIAGEIKSSLLELANNASSELTKYKKIATYSRSSTVEKAFFHLKKRGHNFRVVLSESRPGNEGNKLASNLVENGIDVSLCVDAALPKLLEECDCFICGADAVASHSFANKIGTKALCRTAGEIGIPVYVLAAKDKWLGDDLLRFYKLENLTGDKQFSFESEQIEIVNYLFEWCPDDCVTEFIGDFGRLNSAALHKMITNDKVSTGLGKFL